MPFPCLPHACLDARALVPRTGAGRHDLSPGAARRRPTAAAPRAARTRAAGAGLARYVGGLVIALVVGCGGGGASVGETCTTVAECADGLQCLDHICRPGCLADIDCGDGRFCEARECKVVLSELGDPCVSETECGRGQTCRLPVDTFTTGVGACQSELSTGPRVVGEPCAIDDDCRIGACALGRCTALCANDSQCLRGFLCTEIPRVSADAEAALGGYRGCLPSRGTLTYDVPVRPLLLPAASATQTITVPVVQTATSLTVVTEAGRASDVVGVAKVADQAEVIFDETPGQPKLLRHTRLPGLAVLQIPTTSAVDSVHWGHYQMDIKTSAASGAIANAGRRIRIVEKLGNDARLDLHFYFADLSNHPCLSQPLDAAHAASDDDFQTRFRTELVRIFAPANIAIAAVTYGDIAGTQDGRGQIPAGTYDSLTATSAAALFRRFPHTTGVNVFIVRSLAPAGTEILVGGTPGAPMGGTAASGVAVAMTPLCYQPPGERWAYLARITAHAVARHMGLYRNREPDGSADPLDDSPTDESNLMYWGEDGQTSLSSEQRDVLRKSPVLR
ncbi:MAG: hypothetical protein R3B06_02610 [Kofleriaceae bacterium]